MNPNFELYTAEPKDYALYLDKVPKVYQRHWYASVHNYHLTLKAMNALQSASTYLFQIGKWMNEHQYILQDYIQNTPKAMVLQMEAARNAGALGAKIIGSGGGGCMLAMVTEKTKQKVIDAFLSNGAVAAYEIQLTSPL